MIKRCLTACTDVAMNIQPHTHRLSSTDLTIDVILTHPGTALISFGSVIPYILSTSQHSGMNSMLYHWVKPHIRRLQAMISKMDVVIVTGFSTGGGAAVIAACLLDHPCLNLITFGAPRSVDMYRSNWLRDRLITVLQYQGYYDPVCIWPYSGYHHINHNTLNCGPWLASYDVCLKYSL